MMATKALHPSLAITEAEWQAQVITLAHDLGWEHLHVRRSIGKGRTWVTATNLKGWPDLTLIRPTAAHDGEIIFAELKAEKGGFEDGQQELHDLLRRAGHEVFVWRPSDLDAVVERLARWRRRSAR